MLRDMNTYSSVRCAAVLSAAVSTALLVDLNISHTHFSPVASKTALRWPGVSANSLNRKHNGSNQPKLSPLSLTKGNLRETGQNYPDFGRVVCKSYTTEKNRDVCSEKSWCCKIRGWKDRVRGIGRRRQYPVFSECPNTFSLLLRFTRYIITILFLKVPFMEGCRRLFLILPLLI